jgi:hypothetical protein
MAFDPKYKIRHRVTSPARLARYEGLPPPMVDEPPEARQSGDWETRCRMVYDFMMQLKSGITPPSKRRGLWFYGEGSHR